MKRSEQLDNYVEPDADLVEGILYHMENVMSPCVRELPADWDTRENFDKCVRKLDRRSSPGWPLCREAVTIGKWLYPADTFEPDASRAEMLWQMVRQVFDGEYQHVFKVFIKPEAHKRDKALEGRWRLILASALPVQLAWHMACGHLERAFIQEQPHVPPAYAEVFFGGGWRRFRESCIQANIRWATDKSAWDWNSPGWVYDTIRQLRIRLTRNETSRWLEVMGWLYKDAYVDSKVMLSTGHIYKQTKPGLMKSGLVVTISDNSLGQDIVDAAAQISVGQKPSRKRVTGDDVLQEKPPRSAEYLERLQRYGCKVKCQEDKLEFMGFNLDEEIRPIYPHKHMWNISHQKDEYLSTVLDAYCRLYAKQPSFQVFWQRVAQRLGVVVKSQAYYRYFMDNPRALKGSCMDRLRSVLVFADGSGIGL